MIRDLQGMRNILFLLQEAFYQGYRGQDLLFSGQQLNPGDVYKRQGEDLQKVPNLHELQEVPFQACYYPADYPT